MSEIKKIILLLPFVFFILYCGKSEINNSNFKRYKTKDILGAWKIVPSYNAKILFEKDERSFLLKENEKVEIFALEDARGLRLYYRVEDDSPFAYFLFTEKTKNIWGGIMDNKVVRIVREEQIPESILE